MVLYGSCNCFVYVVEENKITMHQQEFPAVRSTLSLYCLGLLWNKENGELKVLDWIKLD